LRRISSYSDSKYLWAKIEMSAIFEIKIFQKCPQVVRFRNSLFMRIIENKQRDFTTKYQGIRGGVGKC
jgi:hypothetical protein